MTKFGGAIISQMMNIMYRKVLKLTCSC